MGASPRIRAATEADLPRLNEIFRAAVLTNEGDAPNLLAHPEFLEFDGTGIATGRTLVVLTDDGAIAGFSTDVPDGDFTELDDLFVDPRWMRRGFARALIDATTARARTEGLRRVEVTANEHAMAFYTSVGFVTVGRARTHFADAPRMVLTVDER